MFQIDKSRVALFEKLFLSGQKVLREHGFGHGYNLISLPVLPEFIFVPTAKVTLCFVNTRKPQILTLAAFLCLQKLFEICFNLRFSSKESNSLTRLSGCKLKCSNIDSVARNTSEAALVGCRCIDIVSSVDSRTAG